MLKYRCVIFDLDGTIADTIGDIADNINKALAEEGFPPAPEKAYIDMQGREVEALVENAILPEKRGRPFLEKAARRAVELYAQASERRARPYPGIPELLLELKRRKILCAVLSAKPDVVANVEMAAMFPPDTFAAVYGIREGHPYKPDPQAVWDLLGDLDVPPRDAILAGDSPVDMKAALESGCHALGVSWGYRSAGVLEKAGAQRIINHPMEMLEFL